MSGVVLAAGASRRFGGPLPKQLVELDGEPLVRRAARTALAARLGEVIVVVGHRGAEVRRAVQELPVTVVDSPRWQQGQSRSVRAGLAAVAERAAAAVFIPCDQPHLTAELIDRLVAEHAASGQPIVVPAYRGRRGSPVLIARALFPELARLEGDAGGRQLFDRHPVHELELEDEAALIDLDHPADRLPRGPGAG